MADYLLLIAGILLILLGIVGCFLPVLPGPPLSFTGLLMLHFSKFAWYTPRTLIILGIIALAVTILDYIVPVWGTKKFGGSKYGTRGATIGLIIGLFFGPPGIIIGPFAGAFIGELVHGNDVNYATKAGIGSFLGFLAGVGLKLAASFTITWFFFRQLFA